MNEDFQDKFGLVEDEVQKLLQEYDLTHRRDEIRAWYNGYRIGSCEAVYNPWSVINCIANKGNLAPYWVNTSDNALMKQLITQGGDEVKADVETLLTSSVISKTIDDGIVFTDLEKSPSAVWSMLLYSGYVTIVSTPVYGSPLELKIPNKEVFELYKSMVIDWFEKTIHQTKYRLLLKSLTTGDIDTFSQIFQEFLLSSVSVFDVADLAPEKLYHAFVLGMLIGLADTYEVKSNRESGYGRYDVMLIPKNTNDLGIVMEFKKIGRFEKTDIESAQASAFKQIEEKGYTQELIDREIKRIVHIVLVFEGKKVAIQSKYNT